jgi:hypothetical protein
VLAGFVGRDRLREHKLAAPFQRAKTLLVWRQDQPQAKVTALAEILMRKTKRVA